MIHCVHPFRKDKNLGLAYNNAFRDCSNNSWLCLMDWDVLLLTHDAIRIMTALTEAYPETGIFTCWTNRLHAGAKDQLWKGQVSEDTDIRNHIDIAEQAAHDFGLDPITPINHHISGMLMLISKKTWNEIRFAEDKKCLGVDNEYSDRILSAGKTIYRMNQIYVFHLYRMKQGVKDKTHLL